MAYEVAIQRYDLKEVLLAFDELRASCAGEQATIVFDGREVEFSCPGFSISVPGMGRWPESVRFPAGFLLAMAKVPPDVDPVVLFLDGQLLTIHRASIDCHVSKSGLRRIALPLDPNLLDILRVEAEYSPEEIEAAGLTRGVEEAIEQREEIIRQALILFYDFACSEQEIRSFLQNKIKG